MMWRHEEARANFISKMEEQFIRASIFFWIDHINDLEIMDGGIET